MNPFALEDLSKEDIDSLPFFKDQIPAELLSLIAYAKGDNDTYALTRAARKKRLDLLLLRFYNQIQYGCTDPLCDIRTCLSYRKRQARGPVRPFTELSAVALAWNCAEQYATNHENVNFERQTPGIRKEARTQRARQRVAGDGLCWNEPVVPWYTPVPALAPRGNHTPWYIRNSKSSLSTEAVPRKDEGGESSESNNSDDREAAVETVDSRRVRDGPPRPQDSKSAKFDDASFSQSLVKTDAIASYVINHEPPASHSELTDTPTKIAAFSSTPAWLDEVRRTQFENTNPAQPGFKYLTFSSIAFLKQFLMTWCESSKSEILALSTAFVRQSLSNAFSNPVSLMVSMHSWQAFRTLKDSIKDKNDFHYNDLFGSCCDCPYISTILKEEKATIDKVIDLLSIEYAKDGSPCSVSITSEHKRLPHPKTAGSAAVALFNLNPAHDSPDLLPGLMFTALQHAYVLPLWLDNKRRRQGKDVYISNTIIAQVIMLITDLLVTFSTLPGVDLREDDLESDHARWDAYIFQRGEYQLRPGISDHGNYRIAPRDDHHQSQIDYVTSITFQEDSPIYRVWKSIADVISHRVAVDAAARTSDPEKAEIGILECITNCIIDSDIVELDGDGTVLPITRAKQIQGTMQGVFVALWDRGSIVRRRGPSGGALAALGQLYKFRRPLRLEPESFAMPDIMSALDEITVPIEWLSFTPSSTHVHIMDYPFLFSPRQLTRQFRSLNLKLMQRYHEKAMQLYHVAQGHLRLSRWDVYGVEEVLDVTRPHMAWFFVMTIRRSHVLEDAFNQIWRREPHELMRPLKVRIGQEEGEDGLDHGGVQQEFFRLVFAEAFDPKYGMFLTDETTRMTWFKLGTVEPPYKFEMLGLLFALAIYNGVTLPITMPIAFYMRLLGDVPCEWAHIEDGWPDVAKSFQTLLEWEQGDVGDVIARTYEFGYEAFGQTVYVDISTNEWQYPRQQDHSDEEPSSKDTCTAEAPLVTNENRASYVVDYIRHLCKHSIEEQFSSFHRGMFDLAPLMSRKALGMFTPFQLKKLVEGHTTINIDALARTVTYDDYTENDPFIEWFWSILRKDFTQEQHALLLEFVTSSRRVPVSGIETVVFIIQRNGSAITPRPMRIYDDDGRFVGNFDVDGEVDVEVDKRLPSSSTCYGRLLLPRYSTKEILKTRLLQALEHSSGFGAI